MNEVIERLHQAGVHSGLGAFSPPGTRPPLVGLAVPEDYVLPEGYVRHYQATDDGQRIEPILMFSPDAEFFDGAGQPIAIPEDRVVPPELAPPGLADPAHRDSCPDRAAGDPALNIAASSPRAGGRCSPASSPARCCRPVLARRRRLAARLRRARAVAARARSQRDRGRARCSAGWVMSVAFMAAVFAWFGVAIGGYTQLGTATGLFVLLLAAPLLQPQFLAFALVRHVAGRRHGALVRALAGAAAWVATEWLVPRLLGDTLGHGLYPSRLLRQAADLGGAAGLTFLLLLANEGIAAALARRRDGVRAMAKPLALAALVLLLLAGYGLRRARRPRPRRAGEPLRIGLVQSNIVDYERLRREKGADAVVREVLDTHYAMSHDAVERQHVDALLWSETVYPTTFGQPKSEAGAELDREILDFVNAAGVPLVFGTYDRDAAGEYNAAAFVEPGDRPARLLSQDATCSRSPSTCPAWLDGPTLRRWLPWAGTWQPGDGARVFPLRLADGREIPVLPLICLDDVDTGLAIDGARLGAQAILTHVERLLVHRPSAGRELHLAVAAFRSIETRLPQLRVTANGFSAVIDATGAVVAGTRMGERTLVVGDVPVREPPRTLMVAWGDWVGRAGAAFLVLLAAAAGIARDGAVEARTKRRRRPSRRPSPPTSPCCRPPPALAAGLLRVFARGSLLWMGAAMLLGDRRCRRTRWRRCARSPRSFSRPRPPRGACCAPSPRAPRSKTAALVLTRGERRIELALQDIAAVEPWRCRSRHRRLAAAGLGRALALRASRWPIRLRWRARWPRRRRAGAAPPSRATAYAQPAWPIRAGASTTRWRSSCCSRWCSRCRRSACTSTSPTAAPSASTTRSA